MNYNNPQINTAGPLCSKCKKLYYFLSCRTSSSV